MGIDDGSDDVVVLFLVLMMLGVLVMENVMVVSMVMMMVILGVVVKVEGGVGDNDGCGCSGIGRGSGGREVLVMAVVNVKSGDNSGGREVLVMVVVAVVSLYLFYLISTNISLQVTQHLKQQITSSALQILFIWLGDHVSAWLGPRTMLVT